jgi:hypothetical protein
MSRPHIVGALFLAAATATTAAPCTAQSVNDVDRFIKLVRSYDYEKLIGDRVLDTDRQMAPPCNGEHKILSHQIVTITEAPHFIATRDVPVSGKWLDRVTVDHCGHTIRHNVFLSASKLRGLHAVLGFPGETRAGPDLQIRIGKKVMAIAQGTNRSCRRLDIIDTSVRGTKVSPERPWTEIWTSWVCGTIVRAQVNYFPKAGGITYTVR